MCTIFTGVGSKGEGGGGGGGEGDKGGTCSLFFDWGAMICLWPPLVTPHSYSPLELYVYITLTNNYLAFIHIPINYLVDNFNRLT